MTQAELYSIYEKLPYDIKKAVEPYEWEAPTIFESLLTYLSDTDFRDALAHSIADDGNTSTYCEAILLMRLCDMMWVTAITAIEFQWCNNIRVDLYPIISSALSHIESEKPGRISDADYEVIKSRVILEIKPDIRRKAFIRATNRLEALALYRV